MGSSILGRYAVAQGALAVGLGVGVAVGFGLSEEVQPEPGIAQRAVDGAVRTAGVPVVDGDLADWEGYGPPAVVRTGSGASLLVRVRVDAGGLVVAGDVHDDTIDAGVSPLTGDRVDIRVRSDGPIWSERTYRVQPGNVSVAYEDGPPLGPCCASEGTQTPTDTGWAFEIRIPARELPAGRRANHLAALSFDLVDEDGGLPRAMARLELDPAELPPVRTVDDPVPDSLYGCAAFTPGDDAPVVVKQGVAVRSPVPVRIGGEGRVAVWEGAPCEDAGRYVVTAAERATVIDRHGYALARIGQIDDRTRLVLYRFAPGDRHRVRLVDVDERGVVVEDREVMLTDDADPTTRPLDGTVKLGLDGVSWTGALVDDKGATARKTLGMTWDAASRTWQAL